MISNAMFFALGAICFPLIILLFRILFVLSTGKKWMTQYDIQRQKDIIRNSSVLRTKRLEMEELHLQCDQKQKALLLARRDISTLVEQNESLVKQVSDLQSENEKLSNGLKSILERLDSAERKLGK